MSQRFQVLPLASCHGNKCRGATVTSITMKKASLPFTKTDSAKLKKAKREIVRPIDDMKQQVDQSTHSGDHEICFSTKGKLSLLTKPGPSKLLSSLAVVNELLAKAVGEFVSSWEAAFIYLRMAKNEPRIPSRLSNHVATK